MIKKIFAAAALLGVFVMNAQALSVTNPLFMPKEGGLMFDTTAYFGDTTSGQSDKVYEINERISYNLTDRFQVGGYIGYAKIDMIDVKDWTNPGVFAFFRILDNVAKLDIGGDVLFNTFDSVLENGVNDDAAKYTLNARFGLDLAALSVGAIGSLSYWKGDTVRYYTRNNNDNMTYGDIKAFAIFDIMDIVGVGGEAGYKVYDLNRDRDDKGYYLTARVDINPIPSKLGILAFATFEDVKHQENNYKIGASLKFVL